MKIGPNFFFSHQYSQLHKHHEVGHSVVVGAETFVISVYDEYWMMRVNSKLYKGDPYLAYQKLGTF